MVEEHRKIKPGDNSAMPSFPPSFGPDGSSSKDAIPASTFNVSTATIRAIWTAIKHADQSGQPEIAAALFEILERRVQRCMPDNHVRPLCPSQRPVDHMTRKIRMPRL